MAMAVDVTIKEAVDSIIRGVSFKPNKKAPLMMPVADETVGRISNLLQRVLFHKTSLTVLFGALPLIFFASFLPEFLKEFLPS